MLTRALLRAAFGLAVLSAAASAQSTPPAGWTWMTDRPATLTDGPDRAADEWHFTEMAPGWHVTMGPGGILYHPEHAVTGRFAIEAEIFLFPQPTEAGYGIFAGGTGLDGRRPSYFSFLARPDGSAGIFHHAGGEVHTLVDWARHDTVLPRAGDGPVKNVLRLEAEPDSVRFLVNGQRIAALPRPGGLDGQVGLRVGEGVNLHISNLDITRRLAPAPAAQH